MRSEFSLNNLDLLGIPQCLGGGNVETFRRDQRLQIQNLFMVQYLNGFPDGNNIGSIV